MFDKILIANRGEIALRIIATCRELGIPTVIAHSTADTDTWPTAVADEAICIGPPASAASYLDVGAVVTAAEISGATAIHPGYGFLSESPALADACHDRGIVFIGPSPDLLRVLGDKARAREVMAAAGLPVVAGSGSLETLSDARQAADRLGYPVIVKATAGGGGRGLRVVHGPADLAGAFAAARQEAQAGFGDPRVYLETWLDAPRHVEFQVLADSTGQTVQLGDRECSVQRRHQKLLEEAPAPALAADERGRLAGLVVEAARSVGYLNAGTFEFLQGADGRIAFIEANARLQVEHPVTEAVTGLDLVEQQIRIAAGERLRLVQSELGATGHAIECRIVAEHPETGAPSPGAVRGLRWPGGPGIRVDTWLHDGVMVSPFYDGLLAKLVAHGRDRAHAIDRMRRALEMTRIDGVETTIPLHRRILRDPGFIAGRYATSFLGRAPDVPEPRGGPA